ncbi:MAG TPA: SRPBCC family protein [Chloroflexota bacterium]|nr:SRPBCC family protein [Chloroflexota bacterium]
MSRPVLLEAAAVVPAEVSHVWQALLDPHRWVFTLPETAPARLEELQQLDETFVRVGDRRRCAAIIDGLPIVGRRRLEWEEQVTDVDAERTLEIESVPAFHAIRRWRLRFRLVPHGAGHTRLRCELSYRPVSLSGWLADRLVLRRRVATAAQSWVANLAASFAPVEEPALVAEPAEALVAA